MATTINHRGSGYLVALVTMTVALVLGLALMRAVDGLEMFTAHKSKNVQLHQLAKAGVEYGYWLYAYKGDLLPINTNYTMAPGAVSVQIQDSDSDLAASIKVTSTATVGGNAHTEIKIFEDKGPGRGFDRTIWSFAVAANADLSSDAQILTGDGSAYTGDAMFNGNLTLTTASTEFDGQVFVGGTITAPAPAVTGTLSWKVPPFPLPTIDYAAYEAMANTILVGNQDLTNYTSLSIGTKIVYVKGDLKIKGTLTGRVLFVVEGNITVPGNISYFLDSIDRYAFITSNTIRFQAAANDVRGIYYAHSAANTGLIQTDSVLKNLKGCLISDVLFPKAAKLLEVVGDSELYTGGKAASMKLPGTF